RARGRTRVGGDHAGRRAAVAEGPRVGDERAVQVEGAATVEADRGHRLRELIGPGIRDGRLRRRGGGGRRRGRRRSGGRRRGRCRGGGGRGRRRGGGRRRRRRGGDRRRGRGGRRSRGGRRRSRRRRRRGRRSGGSRRGRGFRSRRRESRARRGGHQGAPGGLVAGLVNGRERVGVRRCRRDPDVGGGSRGRLDLLQEEAAPIQLVAEKARASGVRRDVPRQIDLAAADRGGCESRRN